MQAKTVLYLAVEKENIEIVKLLLANDKLAINLGYIFNKFSMKFKFISFNKIQKISFFKLTIYLQIILTVINSISNCFYKHR